MIIIDGQTYLDIAEIKIRLRQNRRTPAYRLSRLPLQQFQEFIEQADVDWRDNDRRSYPAMIRGDGEAVFWHQDIVDLIANTPFIDNDEVAG